MINNINIFNENFINQIFEKDPMEPHYYTQYILDKENINTLNLTLFLLCGAHKLYGITNANEITNKQFNVLQNYIKSIGYTVHYKILNNYPYGFAYDEKSSTVKLKLWFEKYPYIQETNCNGYKFWKTHF